MVLRDLQWRRRRFVLAGFATALVFALTLLLTGVSTAVHAESNRIVERFGADAWLVGTGGSGPFTNGPSLPAGAAAAVAKVKGIERAEPVVIVRGALGGESPEDVNIIGIPIGGLGEPEPGDGRPRRANGEAVVDAGLGLDVGDSIVLAGHELSVVGTASKVAYLFGIPTVFLTTEDAQRIALGGTPVASAIVVQGRVDGSRAGMPEGLRSMSEDEVIADLRRPLSRGTGSIDLILVLLTITAAGIVGLIVYLSTLERTADLAVLKATGSSKGFMASGLAIQAVVLSIGSAVVAAVLSQFLAPLFPVPLEVRGDTYLRLLVLAIVVGVLASAAGVWKAIRVDPALAFGGR